MPRRSGDVLLGGRECGILEELEGEGYRFAYLPGYLAAATAQAVSLTLPRQLESHTSETLFPFFCGLLAEGDLRDIQCRRYRIDPDDEFGLLLQTANEDVIGTVTVRRRDG